MFEIVIVVMLVGLLLLLAVATSLSSWTSLVTLGLSLAFAGLALSLPFGITYHLRLREGLVRCGQLKPRWWLSPTALHKDLDEEGQGRIALPFRLGAAACGLSFLGCVLGIAGLLSAG
jgi:hypothetical protein